MYCIFFSSVILLFFKFSFLFFMWPCSFLVCFLYIFHLLTIPVVLKLQGCLENHLVKLFKMPILSPFQRLIIMARGQDQKSAFLVWGSGDFDASNPKYSQINTGLAPFFPEALLSQSLVTFYQFIFLLVSFQVVQLLNSLRHGQYRGSLLHGKSRNSHQLLRFKMQSCLCSYVRVTLIMYQQVSLGSVPPSEVVLLSSNHRPVQLEETWEITLHCIQQSGSVNCL